MSTPIENNTTSLESILAVVNDLPRGAADAVLYTAQNLTDEQKTQARENIGAMSADAVISLSTKQINSLNALFKAASYIEDVSSVYDEFCDAFGLTIPDEPENPNPHWIVGLAYQNGGAVCTDLRRAVYVLEAGDVAIPKYEGQEQVESNVYPMKVDGFNTISIVCPSYMKPAVAALRLEGNSYTEVGISGFLNAGGGAWLIPTGATHYFCVMRATDNRNFMTTEFENVVVTTS